MSAKDVIDAEVKEFKEDESLMLKVFKLEKFFNKHKTRIIAIVVFIVVAFIGYKINNYFVEQNLIKTNEAYVKLLSNPNDKEALSTLKENQALYQLYILNSANGDIKKLESLSHALNPEIASLAKYKIAMIKGDIKSIENYTLSTNSLLKNPALYSLQRLYLQKGDIKKAKECYEKISKDSVYKEYSKALLHYGITK
jgi:hypothetical protein